MMNVLSKKSLILAVLGLIAIASASCSMDPKTTAAVNKSQDFPYNGTVGVRSGTQLVRTYYKVLNVTPSSTLSTTINQDLAQLATGGSATGFTDNQTYVAFQIASNIVGACQTKGCNGIFTGVTTTNVTTMVPTMMNRLYQLVLARDASTGEVQAAQTLLTSMGANTTALLTNYEVAIATGVLMSQAVLMHN